MNVQELSTRITNLDFQINGLDNEIKEDKRVGNETREMLKRQKKTSLIGERTQLVTLLGQEKTQQGRGIFLCHHIIISLFIV